MFSSVHPWSTTWSVLRSSNVYKCASADSVWLRTQQFGGSLSLLLLSQCQSLYRQFRHSEKSVYMYMYTYSSLLFKANEWANSFSASHSSTVSRPTPRVKTWQTRWYDSNVCKELTGCWRRTQTRDTFLDCFLDTFLDSGGCCVHYTPALLSRFFSALSGGERTCQFDNKH